MDPINPIAGNPEALNQTSTSQIPKIKNPLVLIMSVLLIVTIAITGLFYFQIQKLSKELAIYQSATPTPSATLRASPPISPDNGVFCKDPRPEVCTMECIQNPPYICGSDEKSYCSVCQACSNKNVTWYVIRDTPCSEGFPL